VAAEPYAARLTVDYPAQLDRLTTVFRLIWIIPIAIILGVLTANGNDTVVNEAGQQVRNSGGGILSGLFVATVLMIVFRMRYPRWWFDFARELTRFEARVAAYLVLLTDRYPSTVDEQSVHLDIDYPDVERDLNRWLPLVKWLLAIPHYIVLIVLWLAALVVVVVAWFAILFTGRYPRGLFDFVVGVGRWTLRVSAYAFLLATDRYPPFSLN
jgi:membrane protein YdbS with pleckstrin-like domain